MGNTKYTDSEIASLKKEIDELKLRLEEAKASNAAKETFLSNMSHDIRTPMNAIVGMTALAKKHIDEKARVADALNKIETASSHLLSLINEVLDMSRIDSGRMQIASERFLLGELLHDVVTIIQPQMDEKNHTWKMSIGEARKEVFFGDALRLRQIYVNIINNAVKYTPESGHIDLIIDEEIQGDRCILSLSCKDNGIGMSEDFLGRIFEPFERAGSSTVTKIEGTGLGMSIVKKITEAMGGTINIKSRPGEGTEVTIRVPLLYEDISVQSAALEASRFLIIEANETMQRIYREYLGEFGISHTIVSSAPDAVAKLTEAEYHGRSFDAVIIGRDLEISGSIYDIASYLQKSRPDITLILINEDNWDEIQYHAIRCGIRHFIPLPVFRYSLINGLTAAMTGESGVENASATPDLTGKRILLVEDNMINLEIAKEILMTTGAEVDTAENGREAVTKFEASEEGSYCLILMDVQMPVMNGYEAAGAIRNLVRGDAGSIPIFAMTANTFAEDIAKARESGMNGHIAKPVDINILMTTLRQAVR